MIMSVQYSTPGIFTLGDIRALVDRSRALPDSVEVRTRGAAPLVHPRQNDDDIIELHWDEA